MKKILIIGGSRGIGAAILKQQLERNQCINFSRSVPEISHANLEHHSLDVLQDELPDLEDVSSIIYCPGSINLKPLKSLRDSDFMDDFQINVIGAVRVIKKYLRELKKGDDPSIVLFSTVAVAQGMPFHASVAVAKAGVEALTRTLAAEFAPNIRINCIAPSITDTPLASRLLRNEEARESMAQKHPLKKFLQAEDVASLADYLINNASSGMTGQVLGLDAGMSTVRS